MVQTVDNGGQPDPLIMDAMRGLAAVLVLLSHSDAYNLLPIISDPDLRIWAGKSGVYLFFFLSGYLIWQSAERTLPNRGIRVFLVHRLTRIIPLYYATIFTILLLTPHFTGSFKPDADPIDVIRHLTFTQSLEPFDHRAINPVFWTLTHEMIFYILVPLLFLARRLLWVFLPVSAVLYWWAGQNPTFVFSPFFRVFFMFAIGFCLARYRVKVSWWMIYAALIVLVLVWRHLPHLSIPAAAFVLMLSLWRLPPLKALTPLAWVGLASYSLYVVHYPLLELFGAHTADLPRWIRVAFIQEAFVVTLLVTCAVSYWLIERPGMTYLRDILLQLVGAKSHGKRSEGRHTTQQGL